MIVRVKARTLDVKLKCFDLFSAKMPPVKEDPETPTQATPITPPGPPLSIGRGVIVKHDFTEFTSGFEEGSAVTSRPTGVITVAVVGIFTSAVFHHHPVVLGIEVDATGRQVGECVYRAARLEVLAEDSVVGYFVEEGLLPDMTNSQVAQVCIAFIERLCCVCSCSPLYLCTERDGPPCDKHRTLVDQKGSTHRNCE